MRQEVLTVPADQHGQPTYGPDLARTAWELVKRGARGTFHVVGPAYLSRLEWARLIAVQLGLPEGFIHGQSTAALGQRAPRPLRVRLDRNKLLTVLRRDPVRWPQVGVLQLANPAPAAQTTAPENNSTRAARVLVE